MSKLPSKSSGGSLEENIEDSMKEIGQFAAAKRLIDATYTKKAREVQAQQSSLDKLHSRKADHDKVKGERDLAARAKKAAAEELAKLHDLGVGEIQSARDSLAKILNVKDDERFEQENIVRSAVEQLDKALELLGSGGKDEQGNKDGCADVQKTPMKTRAMLHEELAAAEEEEQKAILAEEQLRQEHHEAAEDTIQPHEEEEEEEEKGGKQHQTQPLQQQEQEQSEPTPASQPTQSSGGGGGEKMEGMLKAARQELLASQAQARQAQAELKDRDQQIEDLTKKMEVLQAQLEKAAKSAVKIGELVFEEDPNVGRPHHRRILDAVLAQDPLQLQEALDAEDENDEEDEGAMSTTQSVCEKSEDVRGEGGAEEEDRAPAESTEHHKQDKQDLSQTPAAGHSGGKPQDGKVDKEEEEEEEEDVSVFQLMNMAVQESSKVVSQVVRAASPARWRGGGLEAVGDSVLSFAGMRKRSDPQRSLTEPVSNQTASSKVPAALNPPAASSIPRDPRESPFASANTAPMRTAPELFRGRSTSASSKYRDSARGAPPFPTSASSKYPTRRNFLPKESED